MNQNRHIDRHADGDDRTLGADLGAAIGRRSESLDRIPPVGGVVERAAAAASARRLRYTLVGVTAAAALIAGGLVAWSTLGRDGGGIQVRAPSSVPERAEPAGAEPASSASQDAAETGDSDLAVARQIESGEKGASDNERPEDPVVTDPDDGARDADPASAAPASEPPTPDEVSTGPTLTWIEVDLDTSLEFVAVYGMQSVGDGRIVARGMVPHYVWETPIDKVIVTADGTHWAAINTPSAVSPDVVDISGDRWLLGEGGNSDLGHPPRAFFSDDEGASWTEVALNIDGSAPDPPSCLERLSVRAVLTSDDRIVVVVASDIYLDVPAQLVARGYVPDTESILEWRSAGAGTLVVHFGDSSDPETVEVADDDLIPGLDEQWPCAAPDTRSGEGVQFLLSDRVRLLVDEGSGAEQVAEYAGWMTSAMGAPDGFSVTISGRDGMLEVTSADGRAWSETRLGFGYLDAAHDGSGTTWYSRDVNFTYGILRSGSGEQPRPVAVFDGLGPGRILAVGPAGIVTTARPRPGIDLDSFDEPAVWIGWSADGEGWGWQTADDAFGIDTADGLVRIELAVGDDFVLARVEVFDGSDVDSSRWFIGRVPS
ncbi:MAG: hypothetical protein OXG69_09410 [bacterium]|nr:hypothetical protein [bacterium]